MSSHGGEKIAKMRAGKCNNPDKAIWDTWGANWLLEQAVLSVSNHSLVLHVLICFKFCKNFAWTTKIVSLIDDKVVRNMQFRHVQKNSVIVQALPIRPQIPIFISGKFQWRLEQHLRQLRELNWNFRKLIATNRLSIWFSSRKFPNFRLNGSHFRNFDKFWMLWKLQKELSKQTICHCFESPRIFGWKWKAHILSVSCFIHCRNCTGTGLINNNGQHMPSFLL